MIVYVPVSADSASGGGRERAQLPGHREAAQGAGGEEETGGQPGEGRQRAGAHQPGPRENQEKGQMEYSEEYYVIVEK